ncbi:transcription factor SPT20 homolog [Plutella xylostella]|uniref:transcription factor SPT20 homolog n=1 Tax=Plutella xylostella TaxID=51655 RepID=UPI0020331B65|nr:transcription factor SPT20 homolog [Plutella xylostella]
MDGLIHAALEAEGILNRAKHVNAGLSYDSGVQDHKMTWTHDKMHLSEPVDDSRTKFNRSSSSSGMLKSTGKFDLFKKLHELYTELSGDESLQSNYQGLKTTSYLLEKLLATYNLNTLIINLYPGNKGYSLSLKINGNSQQMHSPDGNATNQEEALIETTRWPYEEEELLSYIDNEELPVVLMDLLETEHSCLFYSGCVIAQIRDYRQAYPNFLCDTHHVLLRPTNQSIITDAMCIGTTEERAAIESALVLATAPPLCLDPRPAVGLLSARLHSAPRLFNTPRIRRQARRFSQVAINRKRKLDQFTHHHGLELLELIHRQRARNSRQPLPHTRLTSKFPKKPPEVFKPIEPPKMEPQPLALPSEPAAALRLARAYERPRPSPDCQPQLVEEYILETEKTSPHAGAGFFHIKLSILQRPSDQEFLGELYVDRDHVEGERNGAACRFVLGTRVQANKYIQQFTEIFTEEGRKSVRIKHVVPGQLPRVSFTGGMREIQGQQLLLQQRTTNAAQSSSTVQSHPTVVPVVTTIAATSNTHTTARSLPILQAQLQCTGAAPAAATTPDPALKQQPSPSTPRLSPQVHDIHSSQQASTNQLLAQQLTNPPQPLNPQKMQSAIIHIQHPLMSSATTSQVQNIQYTSASTAQQKATITKPRTTNPAISALVTSLMNSAQQFQQAANQNAAAKAVVSTPSSSNATILNLLNSAPGGMSRPSTTDAVTSEHKPLLGRAVSLAGARLVVTTAAATHPTYTQVMSGYRCDNEATNVSSSESALLERLISPPAEPNPPQTTQQQHPTMCHLQGLSLTSLQGLQGIQGLQNVQVQIPGLSAPISLSLNVSGAPSGLLVSVPPTTSVVLANQPSVLSLPIELVRGRGPPVRPLRPAPPAAPAQPPGTTQFIAQAQTLNTHQVRRKSNQSDGS